MTFSPATSETATGARGRVAPVPARILVFGDVLDDIIVAPESDPVTNTDTAARIQHRAGGSAANTSAWLGSLGVDVSFVGTVGASDLERHSRLLRDAGVTPHLSRATHEPTGTVVITVDGEVRTMFTDRGASATLRLEEVTDELLAGVGIVHLTGYSVVGARNGAVYRRLVARIRKAGALVSIDPGSAGFIAEYGVAAFLELVGGADLFFPNLDEGRLLTGETEPDRVVRALTPHFGTVALSLPGGAAVVGRQGARLVHADRVATRLVDPIGLGDAFDAGFLCAWLASPSLALAARRGAKVASLALGVVGGRPSV